MSEVKSDITRRADIEALVNAFYDRVREDPLLGPVFSHVDWTLHLPVMYDFWSSMILGDQSYRGSPFQRHLHLKINKEHFDQWLILFTSTVDDLFAGENANDIKLRARSIASVFQLKMGLIERGEVAMRSN